MGRSTTFRRSALILTWTAALLAATTIAQEADENATDRILKNCLSFLPDDRQRISGGPCFYAVHEILDEIRKQKEYHEEHAADLIRETNAYYDWWVGARQNSRSVLALHYDLDSACRDLNDLMAEGLRLRRRALGAFDEVTGLAPNEEWPEDADWRLLWSDGLSQRGLAGEANALAGEIRWPEELLDLLGTMTSRAFGDGCLCEHCDEF